MQKVRITKSHPRLSDEVGSVIETTDEIAAWILERDLGEVFEDEVKAKKGGKPE